MRDQQKIAVWNGLEKYLKTIVDEAHSSQTGSSAMKLKAALADTEAALREYAVIEGKAEDEIDRNDKLVQEMITHGKHSNLSFFAFTATPKAQTLEMFGEPWKCLIRTCTRSICSYTV